MAATPTTFTSTAQPWPTLQGHQYMNLTTFRKSGEAIVTPVWFAERDGKLYVTTESTAGKVKRIRNNGRVLVGPADRAGKPLGPTVEATARILPPDAHAAADKLLDQKYGLLKKAFGVMGRLRGRQSAFLEIAPA